MTRVYAKIRTAVQLFAVAFLLSACVYGGYPSWKDGGGVVTNNPEKLPDIAWQTSVQREVLSSEAPKAAAAPAATAAAPEAKQERKISVSILLPLTGKNANLGQSMLKASQMALFDIGAKDFDLVPRDTKGTPEGAADAAAAAVAAKADLILGPIFADDVKAVKKVVSSTPIIAFTTDWTLSGSDTYIMGFLPFTQAARVTRYAASKGVTRFASFAPQTEYCDAVISTLKNSDVSVVDVERYALQQSDLNTVAQDFVERSKEGGKFKFDGLMLPVGSESLRTLLTYLDESGMKQPQVRYIGTGLWDDPTLTTNPLLFGAWFAAPDPKLRADFEKRYQQNYDAAPSRLASLAYDATALAAVLARNTTDGGSPYTKDALTNPRGFAGIDGIFRFRSDGLNERGLAVLEIRSGGNRVVDPAPTAFGGG